MAVSHRGAISFGMVYIPVGLYTATQDNDIHFNQLCKSDGSRVKYKKTCAGCGDEVGADGIIKGFEYEKGKYVTITDDDFEKAKTEKDKTITILHFTDISNVPHIYFDTTYHAIPEGGGDKAFELLRRSMLEEGKIAIAKTVMGTKQKLIALIPHASGIMAETLHFADEIKDVPKDIAKPDLAEPELQMAKTLINAMVSNFEGEKYHDEYKNRLWEIIQAKIQGKEIVIPSEENQGNVIDLMSALQESIKKSGAAG